jgi:hypothetical protein
MTFKVMSFSDRFKDFRIQENRAYLYTWLASCQLHPNSPHRGEFFVGYSSHRGLVSAIVNAKSISKNKTKLNGIEDKEPIQPLRIYPKAL